MKNKKKYLFLVIVLLGIGFAYISSNLNIGALVGFLGGKLDVHFENVVLKSDSTDIPELTEGTTVSFTSTLDKPGLEYKFTVDVVNSGNMDAMITDIIKSNLTADQKKYIDYKVTYFDGSTISKRDRLNAGKTTKLLFKVKYRTDISLDDLDSITDETVYFEYTLKYDKAENYAFNLSPSEVEGLDNYYNLSNVSANSMSNLKIYGNNTQYQARVTNLFDVSDSSISQNDQVNTTVDSDGFITVSKSDSDTFTYSNYFTHNLDLVVGEDYTIVLEVKNVTGSGYIYPTSIHDDGGVCGQFSSKNYTFSSLSNGDVKIYTSTARSVTPSAYEEGIRTVVAFFDGDYGSITFRLSVLKGTDITESNFVYSEYGGSKVIPSLDYYEDVNSVTGLSKLIINDNEYPIDFGSLELNGIGAHRDYIYKKDSNWFVHREVEHYKFTGKDRYFPGNSGGSINHGPILTLNRLAVESSGDVKILSNALLDNDTITANSDGYISLYTRKPTESDNIYIKYVLRESYEEAINDSNLISQLNAILSSNLKDGDNIVRYVSNVGTGITFDYRKK